MYTKRTCGCQSGRVSENAGHWDHKRKKRLLMEFRKYRYRSSRDITSIISIITSTNVQVAYNVVASEMDDSAHDAMEGIYNIRL